MKTVFCVDDSSVVLMSLGSILAKAGYQAEKAMSGEEGMKRLETGLKPDLVITDLNMPGIDGIEFIRRVRQMAGMRFVPILFLTTESQQGKRAEAKAAGATGWLVKPVNGEELLNTIKLVLR